MPGKNKLTVKINGRDYTITSEESREYMLSVADLVDQKMKQVTHAAPGLSTSLAAVLAAINMADDYVRLQHSHDELVERIVEYAEKVNVLDAQLKALKNPS